MKAVEQPWIELGYRVFAYEGPQGLKVERLAKGIGKNKSSFYHHFADLEVFTTLLLEQHLKHSMEIAKKEAGAETQEELATIFVNHKVDLLFNRQLRIHRENPAFAECFERVNKESIPAILGTWTKVIGLEDNSYLAELVLQLSLENFFLQITDDTINETWLNGYFNQMRTLVNGFKNASIKTPIDGTV